MVSETLSCHVGIFQITSHVANPEQMFTEFPLQRIMSVPVLLGTVAACPDCEKTLNHSQSRTVVILTGILQLVCIIAVHSREKIDIFIGKL